MNLNPHLRMSLHFSLALGLTLSACTPLESTPITAPEQRSELNPSTGGSTTDRENLNPSTGGSTTDRENLNPSTGGSTIDREKLNPTSGGSTNDRLIARTLLSGRVTLPTGFRIQQVTQERFEVAIYASNGELLGQALTDDFGRYQVPGIPVGLRARVEANVQRSPQNRLKALVDIPTEKADQEIFRTVDLNTTVIEALVRLAQRQNSPAQNIDLIQYEVNPELRQFVEDLASQVTSQLGQDLAELSVLQTAVQELEAIQKAAPNINQAPQQAPEQLNNTDYVLSILSPSQPIEHPRGEPLLLSVQVQVPEPQAQKVVFLGNGQILKQSKGAEAIVTWPESNAGLEVTSAKIEVVWDTSTVTPGQISLSVQLQDRDGNTLHQSTGLEITLKN